MKKTFIAIIFTLAFSLNAKTDLIYFSFNRPMQLYALLESSYNYIWDIHKVFVIYRAQGEKYEQAYETVRRSFANVIFLKQGANPAQDFKPLVNDCLSRSNANHVLFGVDDIIVKDFIDLREDELFLKNYNAYGLYYRLGKHLNECYPLNCSQQVPPHNEIKRGVNKWNFNEGNADWNYPHTVDMTLYRKQDILPFFQNNHYTMPNSLEGAWATQKPKRSSGLFYTTSKIVNLPMNIVQQQDVSRHNNFFTAEDLLEKFNEGYKIDIKPLFQMKNKGAHSNYLPTFIPRNVHETFDRPYLRKELFNYILEKRKENNLFIPKDLPELPEKKMVVIIPSYKNEKWCEHNLDSVFNQNYKNFRVIYINDCSPDQTGKLVANYIKKNNVAPQTTVINNAHRKGALANIYFTITKHCKDDEIVVMLDGDDFLAHKNVLKCLNQIYHEKKVWITYGNYLSLLNGQINTGTRTINPIITNKNLLREYPRPIGHLHSFYAWLFKKIKKDDLIYNGRFYSMAWDAAMYTPMMEMAHHKFACITRPLYLYNDLNNLNDHKINRHLQKTLARSILDKKPYQPLPEDYNHA